MFWLKLSQETSEHTGSYYAATANWQTDYPQLQGEVQADVVIIGGGFTGVNTALELAERGYKVVLVEANRISWGASGRNGGQIIGGIGHDHHRFEKWIGKEGIRRIFDMGVECCEIIRERVAKYDIQCDLKWGYGSVAIKPRHMREFEQWREYQEKNGYPHKLELFDSQGIKAYVNSDNYIGGLINHNGYGHVHSLNLCLGEARAAESLGVQIFEQSRVRNIVRGPRPEVHTDQGVVKAKYVVTCGNAYMGDLEPKLACKVLPSTSCVIATEPLSEAQIKQTLPTDIAVCDPRTALDYFRLTADKRMLFGGLSNYTGLEPNDVVGTLRKKMLKVFPELADLRIDYGWSGQMGIGINRLAQLGRLSDNVFYIQAYSGHGVAPSHMTARVTAEMIAGHAERFDTFAKVKHMSWPGGKLLRRPAMALGMMYYKILDEL